MGKVVVQIALVVGAMVLILWWIFRLRPFRVRTSDLRRRIDYFLDMCESGAGLSFSRDGRSWPVRLSIDRLDDKEGGLSLTLYTADLKSQLAPEIQGAVAASSVLTPQMRRPGVEHILHLVLVCLGMNLANSDEHIWVRGTPTIYGSRTEARIRDDYQTVSDTDPSFLRRVRRYYEKKAHGNRYNAMTSFRVLVNVCDSHAPRYPHAVRPGGTAA